MKLLRRRRTRAAGKAHTDAVVLADPSRMYLLVNVIMTRSSGSNAVRHCHAGLRRARERARSNRDVDEGVSGSFKIDAELGVRCGGGSKCEGRAVHGCN